MKRIIYLGLFISTMAAAIAALLYLIPNPTHLAWLKKGIECLLLIFATWVLLRLLNRFIWPGVRDSLGFRISHIFIVFLNILIIAALFFVISVTTFNLDLNTIVTASGLITAGLAIALQGIVSDIAASIIIDLDRLYKIGDWIKLDNDTEGKVINISWRHTEVLTLNNTRILINNGRALSGPIQNFGQGNSWAVEEFQLGMDHDVPPQRVRRIVETALQRYGESNSYYAEVLARTVDAGGVNYFVRYGLDNPEQRWRTRHHIIDALRSELHLHGLRISEGMGEYGIYRGGQPFVEQAFSSPQDQLLRSNLFHGFSEKQLEKIIAQSPPLLLAEGSKIITKGEIEDTLYIIGEGTVEVPLGGKESRLLHSGNYFGEHGFILGSPRTTDVIAKTNVLLYKYSKADLEPMLRAEPDALHKMLQVMISRSSELENSIKAARNASKDETLEEIIIKTVKQFLSA